MLPLSLANDTEPLESRESNVQILKRKATGHASYVWSPS